MTEETQKELENQNTDAAASELPAEAAEGNAADVSTASTDEGNDPAPVPADAPSESGLATDAPAAGEIAQEGGEAQAPAEIPTTGGDVPSEPALIGTFSILRSRYDGQFLIKHEGGKGYSAPNASAAGHVASNLVAEVVQESINGKFEYAAGAA